MFKIKPVSDYSQAKEYIN